MERAGRAQRSMHNGVPGGDAMSPSVRTNTPCARYSGSLETGKRSAIVVQYMVLEQLIQYYP